MSKLSDYVHAQTYKQKKISYHKFMYEEPTERFNGHNDDRQLYVNIYNYVLEALESIEEEPHNFICCAINHYLDKEYETLDDIKERFNNR